MISLKLYDHRLAVVRKALEALVAGPAAAANDASLRASGSERAAAESLLGVLDRLEDEDLAARTSSVPGCVACERKWGDEGYLRSLGPDALLAWLKAPNVEVTIDVRVALCPAHRAALLALIGPER